MVLGKAGHPGSFLMRYYDFNEMKMPIRDEEWFLATGPDKTDIWISSFSGREIDYTKALYLSLPFGKKTNKFSFAKQNILLQKC